MRYEQKKAADSYLERIWKAVCGSFTAVELEKTVEDCLGREVSCGVNWDQPLRDAAFDLLNASSREGWFDTLMSGLHNARLEDPTMNNVIKLLTDNGVLSILPE